MPFRKSTLILAIAAISATGAWTARSDSRSAVADSESLDQAPLDQNAFDRDAFDPHWSGEYYVEPDEKDQDDFSSFAEKRDHYLNSPDVSVEEEEVDDDGNPVPIPGPSPSPRPSPLWGPFSNPSSGFDPFHPWAPPKEGTPIFGPSPVDSSSTSIPTEKPEPSLPQAYQYYDRGSLRNGTELGSDGKGFVKVFRDRDASIGGRDWGTRSLISLIRAIAEKFSNRHPGYERLQVADIARKNGGNMGHGSHQNGLDADIIYIRKTHREQPAFGGFGKNGFAEQFVVRTSSLRKVKGSDGKPKTVRIWRTGVSKNFDTEANFDLMRSFYENGNVNMFFMDKVLVREMFRYAEAMRISSDPKVRAFLMSLHQAHSHADHFHVRLFCQDSDPKCISTIAPPRSRRSSGTKRPVKKRVAR